MTCLNDSTVMLEDDLMDLEPEYKTALNYALQNSGKYLANLAVKGSAFVLATTSPVVES